jgi:hypothetical protein
MLELAHKEQHAVQQQYTRRQQPKQEESQLQGNNITAPFQSDLKSNLGQCAGLLLSDMGQGLPLYCSRMTGVPSTGYDEQPTRSGSQPPRPLFDAAISISAVQWVVHRPDWVQAVQRFFHSLHR